MGEVLGDGKSDCFSTTIDSDSNASWYARSADPLRRCAQLGLRFGYDLWQFFDILWPFLSTCQEFRLCTEKWPVSCWHIETLWPSRSVAYSACGWSETELPWSAEVTFLWAFGKARLMKALCVCVRTRPQKRWRNGWGYESFDGCVTVYVLGEDYMGVSWNGGTPKNCWFLLGKIRI